MLSGEIWQQREGWWKEVQGESENLVVWGTAFQEKFVGQEHVSYCVLGQGQEVHGGWGSPWRLGQRGRVGGDMPSERQPGPPESAVKT